MRTPDILSLRANLVLFAFAVAVSDAAWLLASALAGRPQWIGLLVVRAATLGTAAAIVMFLRRAAKRAFDAAERAREPGHASGVAEHRDDWLVQLHIDLHPRH